MDTATRVQILDAIILVQDLTRVAVSISYDDNHYTRGTLNKWYMYKPESVKKNKTHKILRHYEI